MAIIFLVLFIPLMGFIAGFLINLLAPVIAVIVMVVIAYFLAIQAFYFACGVYLLPVQIPLLIFTHWHYWWDDSGVFEACYTSPLAWICSTLFYAACLFGPYFILEFRKGMQAYHRDTTSTGYVTPSASSGGCRIEPTLAGPAPPPPAPLTGRAAVAAMCARDNAATLARLSNRRPQDRYEADNIEAVICQLERQAVYQRQLAGLGFDPPR